MEQVGTNVWSRLMYGAGWVTKMHGAMHEYQMVQITSQSSTTWTYRKFHMHDYKWKAVWPYVHYVHVLIRSSTTNGKLYGPMYTMYTY